MRRKPLRSSLDRLEQRVLTGPGVVSPAQRQAAAGGQALGGAMDDYLQKVRSHAYRVTDEEVAALRAAGTSDDALFELTISAALGAAKGRLEAGLAAVAAVYGEDEKQQ